METWEEKQVVYEGPIFRLVRGTAVLDNGAAVPRDVVQHGGGVAVVPLLDEAVLFIRQFRIAVGQNLLELPAGRLEGDEAPLERARLELAEETGYAAGRLLKVADYFSSPGFTNERQIIFLAFDLRPVGQNLEFDERIEVEKVPLTALPTLLAGGTLRDGKTIIGLRALLAHLEAE